MKKPENTSEKKIRSTSKKDAGDLWLTVSQSALFGGIKTKTIRRAIKKDLRYKVIKNRYLIHLPSLIIYLNGQVKLRNKFVTLGIGRYVKEWNVAEAKTEAEKK